jgi:hypothetical protein
MQEGASENLSISWDLPSFKQDYGRNVPDSTDASPGIGAASLTEQQNDNPGVSGTATVASDTSTCSMRVTRSQQTSEAGGYELSGHAVTPVSGCLRLDTSSVMVQTTPKTSAGAAPSDNPVKNAPGIVQCMLQKHHCKMSCWLLSHKLF